MASQQHVVFMNLAATGHMNPTLPLVAELKARGCEVTYFVDETMRSVVEAAGAAWMPFRNPEDDGTGFPNTLAASGVAKYVPDGTAKEQYMDVPSCMLYNAELLLPALLEDLRKLQPRLSLIVYDPFVACGPVAGHVLGVPTASTLTMPGPGVLVKPDEVVAMWEAKPWVEGPRQELVEKYGFDVLKHGLQMEFYSPTLNLVTTIDELYVPPNPGHQANRYGAFPFKCIGVLADTKIKRIQNANVKQDAAEQLDLAELDAAIAAGRRLLYVSLGTVASSEAFWARPFGQFGKDNGLEDCTGKQLTQHVFKACFEAFGDAGESAPLVVLSIGPQADVLEGLPPAPANFRLKKAVPQLEVLRRCSAFVTHCGANSMHEALSMGVPMAAVPIFGDQPINADALRERGAAISFRRPLETVTPVALAEAAGRLMLPDAEKNSHRAAAQRLAGKLQASKSVSTAVDALLEVSSSSWNAAAAGA